MIDRIASKSASTLLRMPIKSLAVEGRTWKRIVSAPYTYLPTAQDDAYLAVRVRDLGEAHVGDAPHGNPNRSSRKRIPRKTLGHRRHTLGAVLERLHRRDVEVRGSSVNAVLERTVEHVCAIRKRLPRDDGRPLRRRERRRQIHS